MPISLIIFFITGLFFSGLAIPLIKRKVKMNKWYGIRIPQTLESESVWFEVHEIMGKYLFAFGILISGLVMYFVLFPLKYEYEMAYILLGILMLGTLLFIKLSYNIANKINIKNHGKPSNG